MRKTSQRSSRASSGYLDGLLFKMNATNIEIVDYKTLSQTTADYTIFQPRNILNPRTTKLFIVTN